MKKFGSQKERVKYCVRFKSVDVTEEVTIAEEVTIDPNGVAEEGNIDPNGVAEDGVTTDPNGVAEEENTNHNGVAEDDVTTDPNGVAEEENIDPNGTIDPNGVVEDDVTIDPNVVAEEGTTDINEDYVASEGSFEDNEYQFSEESEEGEMNWNKVYPQETLGEASSFQNKKDRVNMVHGESEDSHHPYTSQESDDEDEGVKTADNRSAKIKWLANKFTSILRHNPSMNPSGLRAEVVERWGVKLSHDQAYVAKRKAMKIQLVIEKNKKQAQGWSPTWHGDDNLSIFGVTNGIETYCVDLKKEACSCRKCDLSGIPCCHVIACIWNIKKQLEDYVTACYRKSTFMDTYSNIVYSTNEPQLWLVDDLNIMAPPVMRRVMGRQKKQRNKMNDEPRNPHILPSRFLTVKCAKCGAMGHNKRSCKGKRAADRAIPKGGNKSKKTKKVKGGK
ncbi:hypothetical protein KIW84_031348 [Lathyrus oleraceus]|uniref:SWIM-type domain-containing protein n=1 Tax=Pisum sativum TaxID=3888 RepID=A0A9D4XRN0_PEA|nr:hypothetical protein KIW84_031348 [Pisum sativum]